ncbi:Aminodeoxychorismate synthase component 1 [compost metagenome]
MKAPIIAPLPPSLTLTQLIRRVVTQPDAFVLDGGPRSWTFLGFGARQSMRAFGRQIHYQAPGCAPWTKVEDPLEALRAHHAPWLGTADDFPPDAPPFLGGAVGTLAYDLGRLLETLPSIAQDDLGLPDLHMAWYDVVFAFRDGAGWIVSSGLPHPPETREREALSRLEETLAWLESDPAPVAPFAATGPWRSGFTRSEYETAIARIQSHIAAGDIYQANLSQRFEAPVAGDPADLYLRLREANPAPFGAFLRYPDSTLVSASPERFLELRNGRVETLPIKGTRPRGLTPPEDQRLAEELIASRKDRAEHLMIVDLERNDLGRVCQIGSVKVPDLFRLEAHPTVWHLVSTVEGQLREGLDAVDLLRASFPGGSITGAPKLRSMEILEGIEPTRRGPYTGSIGYWGLDGSLDLSIVIRTAIVKDGHAYVQVGGGIVADSDAAAEYQETLDKAAALMRAIAPAPESACTSS